MSNEIDENLIENIIKLVTRISGNFFDVKSHAMVRSRLSRRFLELGMSETQYAAYFQQNNDKELKVLIGLLTTHHTFFYREFVQFEFIQQNLMSICQNVISQNRKTIKIWSAASSRGHEVYSLAIFLDYHLKNIDSTLDFEIWGTDIDESSIKFSQNGIYRFQEVKQIPTNYLKGYWLRGKNEHRDKVMVKDHIFNKCHFETANLLEAKSPGNQKFDLIFCRNALIYFEYKNVQKIVNQLSKFLEMKGLLFTGISEPLGDYNVPLHKVGPCVYMDVNHIDKSGPLPIESVQSESRKIRVVNVDDSPMILKLLKKLFTQSERFELVGQCSDGAQLHEFLKGNSVDLVTLDLHMPVMDGVSYLKQYHYEGHPAVLVISSINRDDMTLAKKALEYGASDYIEKPSMNNLSEVEEEIYNKIVALNSNGPQKNATSSLDGNKDKISPPSNEVNHQSDKTLYRKYGDQYTNYNLKSSNIYLFMKGEKFDDTIHLLKELIDLGYLPKAIVMKSVSNSSIITDFFDQKFISNDKVKIYSEDEFQAAKVFENIDQGSVLCFLKDSLFFKKFDKAFYAKVYLISDDLIPFKAMENIIMPVTSWAFHIDEFINNSSLPKNRVVSVKSLMEAEYYVNGNEIVVLFELKNSSEKQICLFTDIVKVKQELLKHKNITDLKVVGSKLKVSSLKSSLAASEIKIVKEIIRQNDFTISIKQQKVLLSKNIASYVSSVHRTSVKPDAPDSGLDSNRKVKVMVVDDSKSICKLLTKKLRESDKIGSIEEVYDPKQVEEKIIQFRPDVITLDMYMDNVTGLDVYKNVIKRYQIPTIVVSSSDKESPLVLETLKLGAVDFLNKPSLQEIQNNQFNILEKVLLASEAAKKLVKLNQQPVSRHRNLSFALERSIVAIGSSTGGTRALHRILSEFPEQIPPVLISQHIPAGFSRSFAEMLNAENPFLVKEAEHGEIVLPHTVYVAPGENHMGIEKKGSNYVISIVKEVEGARFVPSVDYMFEQISKNYKGHVLGMILTGMGRDGTIGAQKLKNAGHTIIAQDKDTSVIYGMPRSAYEAGVVDKVSSLFDITTDAFKILEKLELKKTG